MSQISVDVDIDIDDIIDQIDTDDLIEELNSRNVKGLPPITKSDEFYTKREKLIDLFDLHPAADLNDIIEQVKIWYYK